VPTAPDIVATAADAAGASRPPLVVVERLEAFLDERGFGAGPLAVRRIGDGGGSNFSFLVERGEERFVLRRPPRPPLPPSAHDMVREARLQLALAPHGIRLPPILAVCEDASVLGVPFYVMRFLEGHVITGALPAGLETPESRRRLGEELVDALVEIHAADVRDPALAAFARPGSYLERQVRRFGQLWEVNATRELPTVVSIGRRLDELLPEPLPETVVHGDYRLGNLMVKHDRPARVLAARLPPTATRCRPNVVRCTTSPASTASTPATSTMTGTPRTSPVPSSRKSRLCSWTSRPWAITRASPRPPTSSASVAMIGWMPR